jgi:hypothetical protein
LGVAVRALRGSADADAWSLQLADVRFDTVSAGW